MPLFFTLCYALNFFAHSISKNLFCFFEEQHSILTTHFIVITCFPSSSLHHVMSASPAPPPLSGRGQRAMQPLASYFGMFGESLSNLYHPTTRPGGYLTMSVAENNVSDAMVVRRLQHVHRDFGLDAVSAAAAAASTPAAATLRITTPPSPPLTPTPTPDPGEAPPPHQYDNWGGRTSLKRAFSKVAELHITRGAPVCSDRLHIAAGCGSLIEHLAFLLTEGDGKDCVLLPTPSYGALWNDFGVRAGVQIEEVPMHLPTTADAIRDFSASCSDRTAPLITRADLDAAAARAVAKGLRPKMLFIINPQNPLGILFRESELAEMLDWCESYRGPGSNIREVHCVIDEVYALSTHTDSARKHFISAAELLWRKGDDAARCGSSASSGRCCNERSYLGHHNHLLWGFSKDFCLGGARCGVLMSHNNNVLQALQNTGYFSSVCNTTQDMLAALISDAQWLERYLAFNRGQLSRAYHVLSSGLKRIGIPFLAADCGLFVWVDLRACLLKSDDSADSVWSAERALTKRLFDEVRILFTPGEATHASEAGWYRVCYAWTSIAAIEECIRRLAFFYGKHRPRFCHL